MAINADISAQRAHEVLVGIIALILFVTIGVIVAGQNETWGKGVTALFLAFALLQIIFNGDSLNKLLQDHPILTGQLTARIDDNGIAQNPTKAAPSAYVPPSTTQGIWT